MGAEVVDGETECRKAVRRQIGAGADWIKVRSWLWAVLGRSRRLPVFLVLMLSSPSQVYAGERFALSVGISRAAF